MATITGITAKRAQEIADASVVSGAINSMGNLLLATRAGQQIDAGRVKGDKGDIGDTGPQGIPGIPGGTAVYRDVIYGNPTTVADQVALANKAATWYNATTGIVEVYMAVTGSAGLTVPGVTAPKTAGWYPLPVIDKRPLGLIYENIAQVSANSLVNNVVANIPTFTFLAGRRYRLVWDASYLQDATNDLFFWSIGTAVVTDSASVMTNITVLGGRTKGIYASASNIVHTGSITAFFKPTVDTTTQIKFTVQRVTGSGGVAVVSSNAERPTYQIYDDGAQI